MARIIASRLSAAALPAAVVLCSLALALVLAGPAEAFSHSSRGAAAAAAASSSPGRTGHAAAAAAPRRRGAISLGKPPPVVLTPPRAVRAALRMSDDASSSSTEKESSKTGEGRAAEESDYGKITSLDEYASKIQDNVLGGGEFGSRGELYVAFQFGILLCIGLGGIPFVGEAVAAIVGPGLILGGLAFVYLAAIQMGTALSPWPAPVRTESEGGRISRDGVFGLVRHPIYAGLLMGMAGLSVVTDSANRLLLTAALAVVMNLKADYEEERMKEAFPSGEYEEYMDEVKGRFLPEELVTKVTDFVKKIVE